MGSAFKYLGFLIAGLVMVQAGSHAWVSSGLGLYIERGGVVDLALFESMGGTPPFPEVVGFMIHGMNGMFVIPVVALALLVVGLLSKLPGAVRWGAIVLGLVVLQVALGLLGHSLSALAFLHGINALVLFGAAVMAGMLPGQVARAQAMAGATDSAA